MSSRFSTVEPISAAHSVTGFDCGSPPDRHTTPDSDHRTSHVPPARHRVISPTRCPFEPRNRSLVTPILPAQRASSISRAPPSQRFIGGSRLGPALQLSAGHRYGASVPLPLSKSQINRLGRRLGTEGVPSDEDLMKLQELIRYYQTILDAVKTDLDALGFGEATSRVKTHLTLIEKLRREGKMELARVQDFAGARLVLDGNRRRQDEAVKRIVEHFSDQTKPPRVIDRRSTPSHGYRAVHVIVYPDDIQVEVQVRTDVQNSWAQVMESLADRWGRSIRYGGLPEDPDKIVQRVLPPTTRASFVRHLLDLSNLINQAEKMESLLDAARQEMGSGFFLGEEAAIDEFAKRQYRALKRSPTGDHEKDMAFLCIVAKRRFKQIARHIFRDKRRVGRFVRRTFPRGVENSPHAAREAIARFLGLIGTVFEEMENSAKRRGAKVRASIETLEQLVDLGGVQ